MLYEVFFAVSIKLSVKIKRMAYTRNTMTAVPITTVLTR